MSASRLAPDLLFASTEHVLGGRNGYDRALSQGRTKLSYRQWEQVHTPEFKAWFGDWECGSSSSSCLIDPDTGEPKPVFHGTRAEFNVFEIAPTGSFGAGIYFCDTVETANAYGGDDPESGRVVEAFLCLKNPVLVEADFAMGEAIDFDSAAIGLLDQCVAMPLRTRLIAQAMNHESGHFDSRLTAELRKLGYDGIIATYPDGCQELIAFDPCQIKSATDNLCFFYANNLDIRFKRDVTSIHNEEAAEEHVGLRF